MTTDYTDMMTQFELPPNPFPGLRPFEFNESLLYFGRDGQSEQLLRKLAAARFMAVIGTSGSGKSSLVRAGLLPALFGGFMASAGSDWRIALFRPSNDPIGNLAGAINDSGLFGERTEEDARLQATMIEATLRRGSLGLVEAVRQSKIASHENVLVVVDQFEELFRFAQVAESEQYQNDAAAFVKLLLSAAHQKEIPIYVVITMRSDFLGDCSLFWDLPEAINEGQYLIPRLTREQRREAITGPIAVCGADITPRLVNRLLNDMGDNPDQLPILQHALMRTWGNWKESHREDEPIDLPHYEAIGGMSAALSLHADEAFNELPDERSQKIAEKLFKGLTEKGADNREIRRPIELKELCALAEASEAEVIQVIEVFRHEDRSFLMPPAGTRLDSDSLIDISHESLIRNWERLKGWVEDEARSARIYRRLAETAVLREKGEAGLYRDPDLQLALDWREQSKPNKTWARRYHPEFETAMGFLDASREARDREARDREAQRRREVKRTRLTAMIFALAFLLSLAALVFANSQRVEANESKKLVEAALEEARHQQNVAEEQRIIADKERANAEAKAIDLENKQKALAAAEKVAMDRALLASENAKKAEAAALTARDEAKRAAAEEKKAEAEVEKSRQLLYAANLNLAQEAFYDTNIQRAQELLEEDSSNLSALRGFEWNYLQRLYDRTAGTVDPQEGNIKAVSLSSSGANNNILAAITDKRVKLWDASSRRELFSTPEQPGTISVFAVSPDGKWLATASDKTVKVWAVGSTQQPESLPAQAEPITALAFSPGSRSLAIGTGNENTDKGGARIYNLAQKQFFTHDYISVIASKVRWIAFTANGAKLALVSGQVLRIYGVLSGALYRFKLDDPGAPALSPDGRFMVAGIDCGSQFKVFDTVGEKEREVATLDGFYPNTAVDPYSICKYSIAFSADGKKLAIGSFNTVKLYDTSELDRSKPPTLLSSLLGQKNYVTSLAFSPDGNLLATNDNETVKIWDTSEHREYVPLAKGDGVVEQAIFSPDNKAVSFTANNDQRDTTKLWDIASQREAALPDANVDKTLQSAFSSNGKFMAAISRDDHDTVKVWNTESRNLVSALTDRVTEKERYVDDIMKITVSPDGKTVATINAMTNRGEIHLRLNLKLWAMGTEHDPTLITSDLLHITPPVFSPDGKTLAYGGADNTSGVIKLLDLATQKTELIRTEGIRIVKSIVFSSDGKKIVVVGYNAEKTESIELWDAVTRKLITVVAEKLAGVLVSFSPDDKTLAIAAQLYGVGIFLTQWDVASGKSREPLKGHARAITGVAFSPDGKTIATGDEVGTVKLWSRTSNRLLITLYNEEPVNSIAFSHDNRMLITGGKNGAVKLWPTAPGTQQYREQ